MRHLIIGLVAIAALFCGMGAASSDRVSAASPSASFSPAPTATFQFDTLPLPDLPEVRPSVAPEVTPSPTVVQETGGAATAEPENTPAPLDILPPHPITQTHMRAFVDYYVALYGGSSAEIWGMLMLESGAQPFPGCGDNGASCGPAQIQRPFYAGFQRSFGHLPQFQRPYTDLITDPEYSVEVMVFAVRQGWGPRWSGWWVYHGMRPPWW